MSEQSELSSKKYVQPATAIAARHTPLNHLHSMTAHKIDSKCEYTLSIITKFVFFLHYYHSLPQGIPLLKCRGLTGHQNADYIYLSAMHKHTQS